MLGQRGVADPPVTQRLLPDAVARAGQVRVGGDEAHVAHCVLYIEQQVCGWAETMQSPTAG